MRAVKVEYTVKPEYFAPTKPILKVMEESQFGRCKSSIAKEEHFAFIKK